MLILQLRKLRLGGWLTGPRWPSEEGQSGTETQVKLRLFLQGSGNNSDRYEGWGSGGGITAAP